MENIIAYGEFDFIKNVELRKSIMDTYNSYETISKLEENCSNYVNEYITPYFFDNIRFSNYSPVNPDLVSRSHFENIVFGYQVLLQQKINDYEVHLSRMKHPDKKISQVIITEKF